MGGCSSTATGCGQGFAAGNRACDERASGQTRSAQRPPWRALTACWPVNMADPKARPVDTKRWRLAIVRHLEDLPRQYAALEHAMASFGADFDLQLFKAAYNTSQDMDAYNRVQAVERGLGRVQNYVEIGRASCRERV